MNSMREIPRGEGPWPWLMLMSRTVLFGFWQTVIAGVFLLLGKAGPWDASAAWWPFTATFGSLTVIVLLVRLYRREGRRYWDLFRFDRRNIGRDLLALLGILVVSGPVVFLPNMLGAQWLFGGQEIARDLLFRPLPFWAAALGLIVFPVTVALSELPNYFAYVMPRLEARTGRPWLAVTLPAFWLAAQHVCLPFLPDPLFIAWRFVMFLPFAFLLALVLRWRPRLLPYLVIFHWLLDLSTALMVLSAVRI